MSDCRRSELIHDFAGGHLAAAVGAYAADAVGASSDRITAVSRFESGNRHAVYKVSYVDALGAAADLVVRVLNSGDADEVAQAVREARVLEKVGGVAAPLLYDFRTTSQWFELPIMCLQFVPGRHRQLGSVGADDISQLGSLLGWVHSRPTDDLVEWLPRDHDLASYAVGRLENIVSRVPPAGYPLREPRSVSVQRRLSRAATLMEESLEGARGAESFWTDEPLVLLHGDAGPGNILWGPGPVLIDWEYARMGDPADDIAYVFDQNGLTGPQRKAFWRGYRKSPAGPSHPERFAARVRWWEPITLLGSAIWWFERWVCRVEADAAGQVDPGVPKAQSYYFEHLTRRLDRFDNLVGRGAS